jgi:hypothetical protein
MKAAYSGFVAELLSNRKIPASLISFNWGSGFPFTEVCFTDNSPIRTLLDGPYGWFVKDIPLKWNVIRELFVTDTVPVIATQFVINTSYNNFINGYISDGRTTGNTLINIAKNPDVRHITSMQYDGHLYTYTYQGYNRRTARRDGDPTTDEIQVVNPPYISPLLITALPCNILVKEGGTDMDLVWVETTGREWAKEFV